MIRNNYAFIQSLTNILRTQLMKSKRSFNPHSQPDPRYYKILRYCDSYIRRNDRHAGEMHLSESIFMEPHFRKKL
jgi:hypothetical protein